MVSSPIHTRNAEVVSALSPARTVQIPDLLLYDDEMLTVRQILP